MAEKKREREREVTFQENRKVKERGWLRERERERERGGGGVTL